MYEMGNELEAAILTERETSPKLIVRLTDVLMRAGLSRSRLYNRIAKEEFPHQVSLGGRAVGWLKREVDDWINEHVYLRSGSMKGISENLSQATNRIPRSAQSEIQRSPEPIRCVLAVDEGSPDLTQLRLVSTKLYFDRSTNSFWLKLLAEAAPACRGRSSRAQNQDRP
jgi:prophage regulatory protein